MPDGIGESISIALAKDPKQRYQSVQEMLEIICAIFGVPVQQVPERLKPAAGGTQTGNETMVSGTRHADFPGRSGCRRHPVCRFNPGQRRHTICAPCTGRQPGTQYIPPAPGGAPGGSTAHNTSSRQPAWDRRITNRLPGRTRLPVRVLWERSMCPAPPASAMPPAGDVYPAEKARRPTWFWIAIGALAVIVILCGIGLGAGLPVLRDLLGTPTATPTVTFTATALPPTETVVPTEPLPSATLEQVIQATDTPPPPPPPPQPTQFAIPTVVPLATQPLVQPSATAYGYKVTIHNNKNYPIFPFRDNRTMGGPIPPYKYIYYLNIPPGPHTFTFCLDPQMSNCPFTKHVNVDKDLDINIP